MERGLLFAPGGKSPFVGWQVSPYAIPVAAAGLFAVAVSGLLWRHRARPGAPASALLMLAAGVWSIAHGMEISTADIEWKTFWSQVAYLGIVVPAPAFFVFAMQTNGRRVRGSTLALLCGASLLAVLLAWTNGIHGLIWNRVALNPERPYGPLRLEHGSTFWIYVAYFYALMLAGMLAFVPALMRPHGRYRRQIVVILSCALVGIASNLIGLAGLSPAVNLTPFGFI